MRGGRQEVSTISGQVVGANGGSGPEPVGDGDGNGPYRALGGLGGSQSFREPEPIKTWGEPRSSERSERAGGDLGRVEGGVDGVPPYLVCSSHKSADHLSWTIPAKPFSKCPGPFLLQGVCLHGRKRYRAVPCKRRDCESCGPIGRWRIAERIAYGVREIERSGRRCAFLVATFATEEAEDPSFKKKAGRKVTSLIRALRKKSGENLQYALTWELTPKRGRLHANIIIGPWVWVDHERLVELWGARISVEWVEDAATMGAEAAKSYYSIEGLSRYFVKLDQAVPEEWGRRVSFSKDWPPVPKEGPPRVDRNIVWSYPDQEERIRFYSDEYNKKLLEVEPGEWAYRDEDCSCFHIDLGAGKGESRTLEEVWLARDGP